MIPRHHLPTLLLCAVIVAVAILAAWGETMIK